MCRLNFYFAHLFYYYMRSLEKNIKKTEIQILKPVVDYNRNFLRLMDEHYKELRLTCLDLYIDEAVDRRSVEQQTQARNTILNYQTKDLDYSKLPKVSSS
jgi:hypothetical protein